MRTAKSQSRTSKNLEPSRRTRQIIALCLLLAAVTCAVYIRVSGLSFVEYDDPDYVSRNPHVQAGLSWQTVGWAFTATEAANWHPMTWLSHALDCQLYGLDPAAHHVTSMVLHTLNVVLLFLLLVRATGLPGRSLLVSLLFALHPLNVESVAWVAERKSVLCTLFFLLTLAAYGWYVQRPNVRRYLLVAAMFVLGLASKPMVITLPCVLLLIDYWPLQRIQGWGPASDAFPVSQLPLRQLVLEKLPLLALSADSAIVTLVVQRTAGAMDSSKNYALGVRLANAVCSYALYVGKTLWPVRLAALYPHPGNTLGFWKPAVATLFLIAASGLVWKLGSTRRYLITGWLWFLGMLVPVIGIIQVGAQAMADRYAYLPLIGVFVIVAWSLGELADRRALPTWWRIAPAAVILVLLSLLTWHQIGYWQNTLDLWSHTLDVTNDNEVAEENLGSALQGLGRIEESLPHFRNGARIAPEQVVVHVNLAATLAQTGHYQEAVPEYEASIRLGPRPNVLPVIYADLGTTYLKLEDLAKSRQSYERSLQMDPQQPSALQGMQQLQREESIQQLQRMVVAQPTGAGYQKLGQLLLVAGRFPEARAAYQQALRLNPRLVQAQQALAAIEASGR
jgi:tetratricopeptide (TPR) repeat protein